jgi:brefeldin A-inhibited guanine nucleotide-exchange protein
MSAPCVLDFLRSSCWLTGRTQFSRYLPAIYPVAAELLARDTSPEVREGLRDYFLRVGYVHNIIEP